MLALYRYLFAELHQRNVDYAVWKNPQELTAALEGSGDLDLYIAAGSHRVFVEVLQSRGFTRLVSHKSFPCVEHYYGYDTEADSFCHLHCYFRIVTGESHIKQFVVPVEPYKSRLPNVRNVQGVNEMHPLLQTKLNIFRRKIKLSCLPGALLFFRERYGYEQEQQLLAQTIRKADVSPFFDDETGWLADIKESSSVFQEVISGLSYRYRYRHWNRFYALTTPLHRYTAILKRLLGKLQNRRKTFPIGFTVAVTGAPESEIIVVEQQLHSWLGGHFNVVPGYSARKYNLSYLASESDARELTIRQLCGSVWQAWIRNSQSRHAMRKVLEGSVVIWRSSRQVSADWIPQSATSQDSRQTIASTIKKKLLQICQDAHNCDPYIDIRLNLQCSEPCDVDAISAFGQTHSLGLVAAQAQSPAKSTFDVDININTYADTGTDFLHGDRQLVATWKKKMWEAVVTLQN